MATNYINPGTFTIGPNCTISVLDANNNEVPIGLGTQVSFNADPVNARTPVKLMQGITEDVVFDNGWKGEIVIARSSGDLDVYWSAFEAQLRAGIIRPVFTILQNITEFDGSISNITFYDCAMTYDAGGTFANEEVAMQKLSFTSPARVVVNNAGG